MNYAFAYALLGFQFFSVMVAIALIIMAIWVLIWR